MCIRDRINENIWYVAEGEGEILQIPSPWLTMTLQARLAWGASTNCLRPELNWIFKKLPCDNCIHVDPQNFLWVNIEIIDPLVPKDISRVCCLLSRSASTRPHSSVFVSRLRILYPQFSSIFFYLVCFSPIMSRNWTYLQHFCALLLSLSVSVWYRAEREVI